MVGHCLGTLRNCVLGKLTREEETDCSLNLPGADSRPLVVVSKSAGFSCNAIKDVVDKRIHDRLELTPVSG